MTRLLLPAVVFAAIVGLALTFLWTLQRRLMYFPDDRVPSPADLGLLEVEPVRFSSEDGLELHGWFFPVQARSPVTVLVFNGNAGNRAYRAPLATALRRLGFQLLLMDYRGYGGNPGTPSEMGLAADGRAARAYLVGRRDVDPARLVYFGESLGSSVAVGLAATHPPAALILRSPFTSMADVGQYHYPFLPVRPFLLDRFDSLDAIGQVRAPVLVIAGERDQIVPAAQSRRLYEAAAPPKELLVLPDADHNDYELLAGDRMLNGISSFLRAHIPPAGSGVAAQPGEAK